LNMFRWQWRRIGALPKFQVAALLAIALVVSLLLHSIQNSPSLKAGSTAVVAAYLPKIETGVPVGLNRSQPLAPQSDRAGSDAVCLPPTSTKSAAFYQPAVNVEVITNLTEYRPKQVWQRVDPTNYGDRVSKDVQGRPVNNELLVVLHETVGDAGGAINLFQTPHYSDSQQSSYHTIIDDDGTVIYLVPPNKRAFGAGDSEFVSYRGAEAVQTNPQISSSVNNFAYHISLETPSDGWLNEYPTHSGYTDAQYRSLAWLVARTRVATARITTHRAIDRDGARSDPRSFDFSKLLAWLDAYPRPAEPALCSTAKS
jgi:N-acetylmuramoyl-L-alanine amidase